MNTILPAPTPTRLTRRALLGRMLVLPLVPALATLTACSPGSQPGTSGARQPTSPGGASAPADAPKTSSAPGGGAGLKTLQVAAVYPYLGYLPVYTAMQRGQLKD